MKTLYLRTSDHESVKFVVVVVAVVRLQKISAENVIMNV